MKQIIYIFIFSVMQHIQVKTFNFYQKQKIYYNNIIVNKIYIIFLFMYKQKIQFCKQLNYNIQSQQQINYPINFQLNQTLQLIFNLIKNLSGIKLFNFNLINLNNQRYACMRENKYQCRTTQNIKTKYKNNFKQLNKQQLQKINSQFNFEGMFYIMKFLVLGSKCMLDLREHQIATKFIVSQYSQIKSKWGNKYKIQILILFNINFSREIIDFLGKEHPNKTLLPITWQSVLKNSLRTYEK
eukprot:TRINITY_DN15667_c1_g2_i3.p1 TRINITY_DN15667_c1_g2~~TRINITY_DN15667_c1_g2_i3.p1  ORF type:complete len:241 (+),score=-14.14 TRINITY_DN15667_c1_g2_i3:718-1440(+)